MTHVTGIDRGGPRSTLHRVVPEEAHLHERGYPREYSPDGAQQLLYDYGLMDPSYPFKTMSGDYTRFGEVSPLLAKPDDMYVIFGKGEELTLRYPASSLPPLGKGMRRTFMLYTVGFCKDMDPYTAFPDTPDFTLTVTDTVQDETKTYEYSGAQAVVMDQQAFAGDDVLTVDGTLSGSWFSTERDGEGFIFDIAEVNGVPTLVLYYFTYENNDSGRQAWLVGSAPIIGNKAAVPVIDRVADKGMMHKNKAARHKSRLNAHVKAMA